MKRLTFLLALAIVCTTSLRLSAAETVDLKKRAEELKNQKWGMFVCWSFSTFSGKEWTPGVKDVAFFKATGCDTDQWARTAKEAGMGYILFLTKHHDGFCLWDTKTTDRKVTKSPLGRDVLAELRKSCDKYGIKLALYFSEGDWTWPGAVDGQGGQGGSNPDVKKAQLRELLTQYGPVEYIWFDHAVGNGGLNHQDTVAWCHQCQPGTLIGFNHGEPAGEISLRECGTPGPLGSKEAASYNKENEAAYKGYLLAEFTYPILPPHEGGAMWFYSLPKHDGLCLPAKKLYQDYLGAVKFGNIFSADVGPDYSGRLREIDVKTLRAVGQMIHDSQNSAIHASGRDRIKAFCIDFNWGPGGSNGFAPPGAFAQADPKAHLQWYKSLGVNTIQTFCVSCDGYAWYRDSGVAPVQPGLKHDFLKEITQLSHKDGLKVMGYFCVGANTCWAKKHPNLSYGDASEVHIPFTNEYIDYLSACVEDALSKTGIDGFMFDWFFSPPSDLGEQKRIRWLDCERQMYVELFGRPFPGKDKINVKEELEFQRRALDRCWDRLHKAAKSVKPDCVIWLSCFNLQHPQVVGSQMFQEVDWLMNEAPDPTSLDAIRKEKGPHTTIVQCLCGWGDQHDPRRVVGNPKYDDVGFYGFAAADPQTTLPPEGTTGNARNIELLRDMFHGKTPK